MSPRETRRGTTAAELKAKLARDHKYQLQTAATEADQQARVRQLRRDELPVVADLRGVGVDVNSVWDLVNRSAPYPAALPILLRHLKHGGYPDRVMESLARAQAVGPAAPAWETLKELYMVAEGRGEEEGLAVALAASATADHLDDLIGFLDVNSRGDSRIHFLRAIQRVGGPRGREVLISLRSDPLFRREVTRLLQGVPARHSRPPG